MTLELTSDFFKVVLGSFDNENFRCQKYQLNVNKYCSKTFFGNHGARLYVIIQK